MSAGRYEASGEAASGVGVAVIGGLMSLGFGALVLTSLLDALAFPDEPRKLTVAEAVALGEPPRDAWIELTDARLDCTIAPSYGDSGSNLYAVLVGADGQARVLVTSEDPMPASCEAWQPGPRVGVLVTIDRHRPAGLDWARVGQFGTLSEAVYSGAEVAGFERLERYATDSWSGLQAEVYRPLNGGPVPTSVRRALCPPSAWSPSVCSRR